MAVTGAGELVGEVAAELAHAAATAVGGLEAPSGVVCRAGVDVVAIDEVAGSLATFGDRYARRLFTEGEREDSRWPSAGTSAAEGLAARFAAKEAVVKVLAPDGWAPPWTDIAVRRLPSGQCELEVSGSAAVLATAAGIRSWAVSLTHHGGVAAAVIVAVCDAPPATGEGGTGGWTDDERRGPDG